MTAYAPSYALECLGENVLSACLWKESGILPSPQDPAANKGIAYPFFLIRLRRGGQDNSIGDLCECFPEPPFETHPLLVHTLD